jgi:hypothetical protein
MATRRRLDCSPVIGAAGVGEGGSEFYGCQSAKSIGTEFGSGSFPVSVDI